MIPLIPTIALAFVSFIASAFIILRIVIPILPPSPLSKRVSPSEFGLPTFRSLSPADKCHVWLASLDLIALGIFIWQVVNEYTVGPADWRIALDPASAIRVWIVVTIRQTCLLVAASMILLHVRMAQPVSFGKTHWMLWGPTALLVFTSTIVAGILAGTGLDTLFYGLTAYSGTVAVVSSLSLLFLVRTLMAIKKNLATLNEPNDTWPPLSQVEDKPRPSFATEDIDAIRDGASWITSVAGSRRNSVSAWSFSTHHTGTTSHHGHSQGRAQTTTHPSVPAKSSFWFGSTGPDDVQIPPVPPLPSPYGPISPTAASLSDPDPFRRDLPPLPKHPRERLGSQTSWLTSSAGSHTTRTAWSFPTTKEEGNKCEESNKYEGSIRTASPFDFHAEPTLYSRPVTPGLADAQVLGGYGFSPSGFEKGFPQFSPSSDAALEISYFPLLGWSIMIWLPMAFVLPYLIFLAQESLLSTPIHVLFVLSVTLSSPLLALNLLLKCPLPVPVGLFDNQNALPVDPNRPFMAGSLPPAKWSHQYKHSTSASVTVVEGRRSGDVWIAKGDAVDGKGKFGRAVSMLSAKPKLSVLPPEEDNDLLQPPMPIRDSDDSLPFNIHGTPGSETSVQFGKLKKDNNSQLSTGTGEEGTGFSGKIMVAQRHYSALAQTVVIPSGSPTPGNRDSVGASTMMSSASGVASKRASRSSHLRTRSVSSINRPSTPTETDRALSNPTPPPSFPLPPTPPNVRAARLAALAHKKSFSSGAPLNVVDDMNEIDAMTAGVLPILVPGLKVGDDMKITDDNSPPGTWSKSKGKKASKRLAEFGADFSSPEVHSTPARRREPRGRKQSGHKRNHFSLPSLSLGKEGIHSLTHWGTEIRHALETRVSQYTAVPGSVDVGRPNSIAVTETVTTTQITNLHVVEEEDERNLSGLHRSHSTRSLGLRADVPHNVDTARSSMASLANVPPSAASSATLFEDFEAGLQSGAVAESTPHNTVTQRPTTRHSPPPMPIHESRRPTIRYIKSDPTENDSFSYPMESAEQTEQPTSMISALTQWTSNVVRPKANNGLERKSSDKAPALRPLTLLKDRANMSTDSNGSPSVKEIRPLTIGKRQKQRVHNVIHQDENANPGAAPRASKNVKQLTLARSETSKQRAVLRRNEVLPDVIVRPPSLSDHQSYSYNFRD